MQPESRGIGRWCPQGLIGYFPTYAIGNAISLQLWESALAARPGLEAEIENGGAPSLLSWLRENVHRRGKAGTAEEIVKAATGRSIDAAPYLRYMTGKFGRIDACRAVKAVSNQRVEDPSG